MSTKIALKIANKLLLQRALMPPANWYSLLLLYKESGIWASNITLSSLEWRSLKLVTQAILMLISHLIGYDISLSMQSLEEEKIEKKRPSCLWTLTAPMRLLNSKLFATNTTLLYGPFLFIWRISCNLLTLQSFYRTNTSIIKRYNLHLAVVQ